MMVFIITCRVLLLAALLLVTAHANNAGPPAVEGYYALGRGSCQDADGRMYSYLQRTTEFPNAETCGKQECERFGGLQQYRGFEYSVTKRCTCVFDADKAPAPPPPADSKEPEYVSKINNGIGPIASTSGTPGADCYRFAVSAITIFIVCFCDFSFTTHSFFISNHDEYIFPEKLWNIGWQGAIYKTAILASAVMYLMY
jgi:hypothetical protein